MRLVIATSVAAGNRPLIGAIKATSLAGGHDLPQQQEELTNDRN